MALVNALELLQNYRAQDQAYEARAQEMEQAAQTNPLQVQGLQQNMLAKQMAMDQERQKQNALRQFGQTGNVNMLAAADPKMAMQLNTLNSRNALAQQRMNQPIWDSDRGVFVQRPGGGPAATGVVSPDALPASNKKTPPGYRSTPDGNLEAIPGGPADLKQQGMLNADTAQLTGSISSFDRLAAQANEVLNHPGLAGISGLRGALPNIPGGAAADAQAKLNTLKSQVGFGVLQDMRNNSKTGGALGAVSDAEGKRLEANLAALEKAQSFEQFQAELKKIVNYSNEAKERVREAYNLKHGDKRLAPAGAPTTPAPNAPPEAGMMKDGYRFKGGNPADKNSWEKM